VKKTLQAIVATVITLASSLGFGQALETFLGAVEKGDTLVVAGLLGKGMEPDTADQHGSTALMIASRMGHESMVVLLLNHKASVAKTGPKGDNALMMASLKGHVGVARILVEAGAPVRKPEWTPLHYAAFEGRAEMIRYLLDKGAEKDAIAPNGHTALMLAARGGHVDAARVLLHDDADPRHKGPQGETALLIATWRKDTAFLDLLKRAGVVE